MSLQPDYYPDRTNDETVEIPRWAIEEVLVWSIEGSEVNFSHSDDTIVEALTEVWCSVRDVDYLCELCSYPSEASWRLEDGDTLICTTHANALENGSWDGTEHEITAITGEQSPGEDR